MEKFIVGIVVGAFMATFLATVADDSLWRIEITGHGYAHFDKDRHWHWNDETVKP